MLTTLVDLRVHERRLESYSRVRRPAPTTCEQSGRQTSAQQASRPPRASSPASPPYDTLRSGPRPRRADLFHVALTVPDASAYQLDHRQRLLAADWAHVPIPRGRALFRSSSSSRRKKQVTRLLDADRGTTNVART